MVFSCGVDAFLDHFGGESKSNANFSPALVDFERSAACF